jgi:hypothetical protein
MPHADNLLTLSDYLCRAHDYMLIVLPFLHFLRLMRHKPDCGSRAPVITHFSLFITDTVSVFNETSHPLSHNRPTEMSELLTRPGNTRAFVACGGKSVNNKSRVCDDWIDVPLGMLTLSGMCAACLLVHGAVADKKLLLHT